MVRRASLSGSAGATSTIVPPVIATSSLPRSLLLGSTTSPPRSSRSYFIAIPPDALPARSRRRLHAFAREHGRAGRVRQVIDQRLRRGAILRRARDPGGIDRVVLQRRGQR